MDNFTLFLVVVGATTVVSWLFKVIEVIER